MIAPLDFIPVAEETGLIVPIGKWVLDETCRQIKAWEGRSETKGLKLSMNVSARELKQSDFVDNVKKAVERTRINPSALSLEITESILLDNIEEFIVKMKELKEIGISFALDDFGTGYSSLSHLKRLPINELKIDKSFVRDLGVDKNDEAIVRTIIQMGETLGMDVVAEGVETPTHRAMLERYGCHNYQGYLFGKPTALENFERELE
jgi:EAL domain-containing protein (putative c-di-GMP-specific phosphodiesterase class I)